MWLKLQVFTLEDNTLPVIITHKILQIGNQLYLWYFPKRFKSNISNKKELKSIDLNHKQDSNLSQCCSCIEESFLQQTFNAAVSKLYVEGRYLLFWVRCRGRAAYRTGSKFQYFFCRWQNLESVRHSRVNFAGR